MCTTRHASILGTCHAVLRTDCEHGVAPAEWQLTLPHALLVAHTWFSSKRLWTGCWRGEALTSVGGRQLKESDSLAQGRTRTPDTRPQCDLVTLRHE